MADDTATPLPFDGDPPTAVREAGLPIPLWEAAVRAAERGALVRITSAAIAAQQGTWLAYAREIGRTPVPIARGTPLDVLLVLILALVTLGFLGFSAQDIGLAFRALFVGGAGGASGASGGGGS